MIGPVKVNHRPNTLQVAALPRTDVQIGFKFDGFLEIQGRDPFDQGLDSKKEVKISDDKEVTHFSIDPTIGQAISMIQPLKDLGPVTLDALQIFLTLLLKSLLSFYSGQVGLGQLVSVAGSDELSISRTKAKHHLETDSTLVNPDMAKECVCVCSIQTEIRDTGLSEPSLLKVIMTLFAYLYVPTAGGASRPVRTGKIVQVLEVQGFWLSKDDAMDALNEVKLNEEQKIPRRHLEVTHVDVYQLGCQQR